MADAKLDPFSLLPTTAARVAALLQDEKMSDVVFLVGGQDESPAWRFSAHKFVLALSSPVFRTMFSSSMSEGEAGIAKVVVTDIHPAAFENLLQYIYTDHPQLNNIRTTLDTLYAAYKYMLYDLAIQCIDYLSDHVDKDNAIEIHAEIKLYDVELNKGKLLYKCLQLLDREAASILKSQSFGNVDFSTLRMILKREFLNVPSELNVFEAASYWATQECRRQNLQLTAENKRKVLGNALYLIQYLAMSSEEFHSGPSTSGLLSTEEKQSILSKIFGDEDVTLPASMKRRGLKWKRTLYECYPIKLFRKEPRVTVSNQQEETMKVATNRDIVLTGFDLYGCNTVEEGVYDKGLQLTVHDTAGNLIGKIQWKIGQKVQLKEGNKLFVSFNDPIYLKARKKYKIHLHLPKGEYFMGDNWEGTTTSKYKCRSIDFAVKYCKSQAKEMAASDDSDDENFADLDSNTDEEAGPSTLPSTESKVTSSSPLNAEPDEGFVRSHFHGVKFYF